MEVFYYNEGRDSLSKIPNKKPQLCPKEHMQDNGMVVWIVGPGRLNLGISTHLSLRKDSKRNYPICFISAISQSSPPKKPSRHKSTHTKSGKNPSLSLPEFINDNSLINQSCQELSHSLIPHLCSSIFSELGFIPNSTREIKVLTSQGCSKDKSLSFLSKDEDPAK